MGKTLSDIYKEIGEITGFKDLEKIYEFKSKSGNLAGHMETFKRYASKDGINHITEFGFGKGGSGAAFLMAKPKTFITYDIRLNDYAKGYKKMTEKYTNFIAIEADTASIEIEPTDMLFIDSSHTYSHLKKELELHADKVRKYILMHDTVTFGVKGQDKQEPGLGQAISEFLKDNPHWFIKESFDFCHGLTVLERRG
jgi:hypothetical protein